MWLLAALSRAGADADEAGLDDAQTMVRLAKGEASACAELYDRHARLVFSLLFRMLQNEAEAEDVAQDVFVQAWQQAGRYNRQRGSVSAWLITIARSRALDKLRSRRSRPEGTSVPVDEVRQRLIAPSDAFHSVVSGQEAFAVQRALTALPLAQRIAIELAYYEGLTQSEIAQRLEEPLGTIKTRIRNGLLKLRDALAPGPGEPQV